MRKKAKSLPIKVKVRAIVDLFSIGWGTPFRDRRAAKASCSWPKTNHEVSLSLPGGLASEKEAGHPRFRSGRTRKRAIQKNRLVNHVSAA